LLIISKKEQTTW